MIRRDAAQDADRPHYFSQYWINVASGKPTTRPADEAGEIAAATVVADVEPEPPVVAPPPRVAEPTRPARPAKAPERKPEPARLSSLADLANIEELMKSSAAMEDDVVPDIEIGAATGPEPAVVTDFDLGQIAEEPEIEAEANEDLEDYEDFDEDEEEDEWGGRKPGKGGGGPKKPAKPQRPPRRREF